MKDGNDKSQRTSASVVETAKIAGNKLASAVVTTAKAARDVSSAVMSEGTRLGDKATTTIQDLRDNHEKVAEHAKTIEDASKIVAGVTVAGAAIAAPTGLTAVGVALGVTSAPLIVTAAPIILSVAGTAATVAAAARLYSKSMKKSLRKRAEADESRICSGAHPSVRSEE